jgi:hypothetical protein
MIYIARRAVIKVSHFAHVVRANGCARDSNASTNLNEVSLLNS